MTTKFLLPLLGFVAYLTTACTPQMTSTCSECEFVEYEYTESLSIITGFDSTQILVEQPYNDWQLEETIGNPQITISDFQAPDSTIVLTFTVEAGAGSEDARAFYEVGYDGEQFRVWYGSSGRNYFKGKALANTPRPPYFRIKKIEVQTPVQKEADIQFNIRYPS